jgi:hypothetical protein
MPISFRKNILSETPWIYITLLIALSFAIYWRTLSFGFVFDDYFQARHFSLKEVITTFYGTWEPRGIGADFYRPLVIVSYALSYFMFKTNPFGYHLTNILLNTVNVILVYFIMKKIKTNSIFSFVAAILFLLIPYNFVPVSWVAGKVDIIMTLFYLSSFLAFITFYNNQHKALFYYLSILGFIFSLMSKEMAVTLPFILLTYAYLRSKRLEIKLIIPWLVILCAYMLFRFLIFKGIGRGAYGTIFPLYEITPVHWCLAFLRTHLLFSYVDSYYLLIYLALIFTLFFLGITHFKSFENKNMIFFAFSWIMVASSRMLYLPSVGFVMLLSLVCLELHKKNFKYPVIFVIGLCLMLVPVNMRYQDKFSPTSKLVLDLDKEVYAEWYNKLDKEQLTIVEQKLKRYGLLDETKNLKKREIRVQGKITIAAYIKELYEQGGLNSILRKHFVF